MVREAGDSFELDCLNLAEFSRSTEPARLRARTLEANGLIVVHAAQVQPPASEGA